MHKPLPFGVVEEQDYKTEMDMWGTMSKVEDAIHELVGDVHQLRYRMVAHQIRLEKAAEEKEA